MTDGRTDKFIRTLRTLRVDARTRLGVRLTCVGFWVLATGLNPLVAAPDPEAATLVSPEITAAASRESQTIRRFVLAVGARDGGRDRLQLRYPLSDAESVLKVFRELGGVAKEDAVLVLDPDLKTFYTEAGRLHERMLGARADHSRIELIFYYSGHSDESHVLLAREKVSYADLRQMITGMPADVRIGILDSCSSGAFTRPKGGKKRAPFLVDEAFDMKGYAFMTSSSATEASQESDLIRASYFTHFLISGLRGAADRSQDGRVTLNEAYQFAFDETLAETTKTLSGPQHPNYNIEMSGRGDVVMTDIRKSSTVLILGPEISGKIFIHDANEKLVLEMRKPQGREIQVGLEEGRYRVIIIDLEQDEIFESTISLEQGKSQALSNSALIKADRAVTTSRGPAADKIIVPRRGLDRYGPPLTRRHSLSVRISGRDYFQSAGRDFAFPIPGDVLVSDESGGPFMKFGYSYRIFDRWAASFSFGRSGKESSIQGDYFEDCSFLFLHFGVQYFLLNPDTSSSLRPYLTLAPGILIREASRMAGGLESFTESAFVLFGGVGADILLGRILNLAALKLSVEGGLNLTSGFSRKIRGRDNMSGVEISAGLGFAF